MNNKYNLGDKVWVIMDDKIREENIVGIFATEDPQNLIDYNRTMAAYSTGLGSVANDFVPNDPIIFYTFAGYTDPRSSYWKKEKEVFKSKEELINSL